MTDGPRLDDCFSLVYASSAVVSFSQQDLVDLLKGSKANNSKLGITGMLLFKDGNFLQVLEGNKEKVLALYEKITKDPRHSECMTLFKDYSTQRDFPDWSMGFRDLDSAEARSIPGYTPFLKTSLTTRDCDARRAKKLLLLFKEEGWLGSTHKPS